MQRRPTARPDLRILAVSQRRAHLLPIIDRRATGAMTMVVRLILLVDQIAPSIGVQTIAVTTVTTGMGVIIAMIAVLIVTEMTIVMIAQTLDAPIITVSLLFIYIALSVV